MLRRHLGIPLALLAALLLVLAGCGSENDGGSESAAPAAAPAESGAFPVTLDHKYGSTTIEAEPKRVVVVGLREQDSLLALGIVPVAATEWYGKHPGAIFPWAKQALGSAKLPTVLNYQDGVELEKVAAQRPDLILAVYSGITKKDYTALSKLAPTIAQPKGQVDYGSSWQEETLITGKAVGRPAKAQELVDETEQLIADAAAKHPEFKGQTAANVTDYQGTYVYGPQDVRSRMLEDLGFTFPKALENAFPDEFGGELSDEKIDVLDVGALIWFTAGPSTVEKLEKKKVYAQLGVHREGRDIFISEQDRVYDATSFPSVLSMPVLLKELVPRLAAAADGDPKTSTDQDAKS